MPKIRYEDINFSTATLDTIDQANAIIAEYARNGETLTVRQIYYQFVSRVLIENNKQQYSRLKDILSNARKAGLVDWDAIEDRTRDLNKRPRWDDSHDILEVSANAFRLDPWLDQEWHVEVWIEKAALTGVIHNICAELRVDYFACRGYNSQSEQWLAAQRMLAADRRVMVVYLGDHDPSGMDMTKDLINRFNLMAGDHTVNVKRIALNMDQVDEYNPPPNFVKATDARTGDYIDRFGTSECWELDALEPKVIRGLIQDTVEPLIDYDVWNASIERENDERSLLSALADNWDSVKETL